QDWAESIRWYRLAAARGDTTAQHNLGLDYAHGHGVERDCSCPARKTPPGWTSAKTRCSGSSPANEHLRHPDSGGSVLQTSGNPSGGHAAPRPSRLLIALLRDHGQVFHGGSFLAVPFYHYPAPISRSHP